MTVSLTNPPIIQGGMGVGISDWRLARAVSLRGQLGVVSGTALDTVMVRLAPGLYFRPEGRRPDQPYRMLRWDAPLAPRMRRLGHPLRCTPNQKVIK